MAKKVEGYIKLQIPAGKATPAPPVGPALGQHGALRSNRPLLALRAARPDCFRSPAGQNAPQDRFVSPASSPVRLNQTQRHPTGASVFGAGGGTRTHTVLLPTDFESVTSANSITPANMFKFCTYISLTHFLNGFKRENHIILKI